MKDILIIEQIQRRATKYLSNDYTSSYKTSLIKLKILPLMYLFELQGLLFAVKSINSPIISIIMLTLALPIRIGRYWKCDMRLLHELYIVIIAILHAKIEAQPHSLKVCNVFVFTE